MNRRKRASSRPLEAEKGEDVQNLKSWRLFDETMTPGEPSEERSDGDEKWSVKAHHRLLYPVERLQKSHGMEKECMITTV